MIPPDQEIYEVEQRIAMRRAQVAPNARVAKDGARQKLASPLALVAAAGLGFIVAGGFAKKRKEPEHPQRRKSDHTKAAKATSGARRCRPRSSSSRNTRSEASASRRQCRHHHCAWFRHRGCRRVATWLVRSYTGDIQKSRRSLISSG